MLSCSSLTFLEANGWVDEGTTPIVRPRAHSCVADVQVIGVHGSSDSSPRSSNELGDLKDCLRKQQAQLDTILTHLNLKSPNTAGASNVLEMFVSR